MTNEEHLENHLQSLAEDGKWIELSLHPPRGTSTITRKPHNRCFINEGRYGKFDEISEGFYDQMVARYDSRENRGT